MANLRFSVKVLIDNPGALPELQYRMADLSPTFQAIYEEWAQINAQKFEQAVGQESGGAQVFEEFWAGLSSGYMREKHGEGSSRVTRKARRGAARYESAFPDWILVRTGALREAMTDPGKMLSDIGPDEAAFGEPADQELADIVRWQAGARQHGRNVIFLSLPDMNAIRRNLQDYLSMGGDFQEMRSDKALQAVALEREIESMDAEFKSEVGE